MSGRDDRDKGAVGDTSRDTEVAAPTGDVRPADSAGQQPGEVVYAKPAGEVEMYLSARRRRDSPSSEG